MIAGAVITLESNPNLFESVNAMSQLDEIEMGELVGCRLPITIEANDPAALESLTRQIGEFDGVKIVDIAFVSLENDIDHDVSN